VVSSVIYWGEGVDDKVVEVGGGQYRGFKGHRFWGGAAGAFEALDNRHFFIAGHLSETTGGAVHARRRMTGSPAQPRPQALTAKGLTVLSWPEALESGKAVPTDAVPPTPDDYCTIMYTSGTTGEAEGRGRNGAGQAYMAAGLIQKRWL
jgi:acyl-CoA synthetase (AMP-forming)/AMP-acid ligase II